MPWIPQPRKRDKPENRPEMRHVWERVVTLTSHAAGIVNTLAGIVLSNSRIESRLVNIDAKLEALHSILRDVPIPARDAETDP